MEKHGRTEADKASDSLWREIGNYALFYNLKVDDINTVESEVFPVPNACKDFSFSLLTIPKGVEIFLPEDVKSRVHFQSPCHSDGFHWLKVLSHSLENPFSKVLLDFLWYKSPPR